MEAPLHHSPLPIPAPIMVTSAPPLQHDAIIDASSAVLQQQHVSAVSALAAHKPPPPSQLPPMAMMTGREQCPRCASRDTKFCYYNNYNTAQPRHFCRSCRRHWTLGGSLHNVPFGGSTRKRPRPARGPTRALAAAVATTSLSSSAGATTTVSSSCGGPFAAAHATVPVPASAPASAQSGALLGSLLLGSLLLLEGRLGFDLGQPAGDLLALLGFGAGQLLLLATVDLQGDRAAETTASSKAGSVFPPAATPWQELAAAIPAAPHQHHGTSQLLL